MTKIRVLLFFLTLAVVGIASLFVSYYARGYRLNLKTLRFQPNGILVIKSEPDGASVIINGELRTATNATLSLSPGNYDIEVKKDGFFSWSKRLTIEKEVVTQAGISLFKNVPSLSPVTYSGAKEPAISADGTKIAFAVLPGSGIAQEKIGLWTVDTYNLPLGFSNSPKRITDGDLTNATFNFSPDGRQIMLTISNSIFILESGSFISQGERINVASKKDLILSEWEKESATRKTILMKRLPEELTDILSIKTKNIIYSPDENMILYTATASAIIANNLVSPLPGASTQKQERDLQTDHTYVYDIKEDRNFLITNQPALRWMPGSRHLLLAEPNQISIMDYDGTNRQIVYSGSYIAPFAFPFTNSTKLLILTNLGGASTTSANLYTLTVK